MVLLCEFMPPGAPYVGTGVKAYTIHPSLSAFRHWDETAEELPAGAKMEVTDCFMSMEVSVANIHGQGLNFTASTTNKMIWAIHEDSLLKHYHGYCNKGRVELDFTTVNGHGKYQWAPSQAACATSTTDTENDDKIVDERNDPSTSASISSHGRAQWLFAAAFVALFAHAAFPWV